MSTRPQKSLLILKSHPAGLANTESFLRNRGWNIFSTSDIRQALIEVVSEKYAYVLISVDHSNKKIPLLPKLIREKFKVPIVTFAESTSTRSFNTLTTSSGDYKIYAPITGPAVERCINKFLKDQESPTLPSDKKEQTFKIPTFIGANDDISSIFVSGKKQLKRSGFGAVHTTVERPNNFNFRIEELRRLSSSNDSLIARATEISLMQNVDILDGQVLHKVEQTTAPVCIFIDSERFSGYLVAAFAKDEVLADAFIKKIQTALFDFLKKNGEHTSETEASQLKIKRVAFEPWALECADFLKTTVHQGHELAMAFFPVKPVYPDLHESQHPEMLRIQLNDLKADCPINFDLYLHLEKNNKYLLYTPKDGVLYKKQLDRLRSQGLTHMHVSKSSLPAVSRYQAQNYLNDLIDDYQEKQRFFGPSAA